MENSEKVVTATETAEVETSKEVKTEQEVKTFTRDEVNKIIASEKSKIRDELTKENEFKQEEAKKLAKMDEEQRHKYELEKVEKEKLEAISELQTYKLKDQVKKIASSKGLDQSLLDIFDYQNETAESIMTKLESLESKFKDAVEKKIDERLREPSPKQVKADAIDSNQEYLSEKYKNNPYFKK